MGAPCAVVAVESQAFPKRCRIRRGPRIIRWYMYRYMYGRNRSAVLFFPCMQKIFCARKASLGKVLSFVSVMKNGTHVPIANCVWTVARAGTVSWTMCTYPKAVDRWISAAIQTTGCFALECDDVLWMLGVMRRWPHSELLDLGGNIGFYSLAAAADGHSVVVFEPSPDNVVHLLASARANSFRNVRVFPLCVSDTTGPCELGGHRDNQGALQHSIRSSAGSFRSRPTGWRRALVTTMAVRVDDVLPPRVMPTFLKMDIEGGECEAFRGMRHTLNESAPSTFIGALIEFDKSRACCHELVDGAAGGAFWLFKTRHGLCPYLAYANQAAHKHATRLDQLCQIGGSAKQLNLRWERC